MRNFSVAILGVFWLALAACTKADTKPDGVNGPNRDDAGNATFVIHSFPKPTALLVSAQDISSQKDGAKRTTGWRIPREAVFTLGACIKDASTHEEARGHKFKVEIPGNGGNIGIYDVTPTRPNGCFTWMETIPFQYYVNRSRWVVVERDIVGTGIHSGRQRVRIALNPWAVGEGARDSGEAVYYLRDGTSVPSDQLVENTASAFGGDAVGDDQLFVDEVSVQTIRRGEGRSGTLLRMNITMQPKVRFQNAAGVPQFKSIPSGDFDVRAHLVLNASGGALKDRVILTSDASGENEIRGTGRVVDGKLIARVNAWVDPRLQQGNLELVLKVIPTVRGLKPFGGVYELGAMRALASNLSGALREDCRGEGGCDTGSYLRAASNFQSARSKQVGESASPYLFDRLRLRFVQVQPGETATRRTVAYSASTCVVDAFTGDRVVGLNFKIKYKGSATTIDKKTAEDGCLSWDATIFHQYYMPEEFVEQEVSITKDTGVEHNLKFYINPWDDKFTFGFDEREFTQDFWAKLKSRKKIRSRFFLSDYGYHTVRFQYNIDNLMNLEVRKTVLMELQPQVLRYSGIINARKMTEPLRDGIWMLKVGLQKNYLDPAQAGVVIDKLQNNQSMVRMLNEPAGAAQLRSHTRLRKLGIEATTKEYISTETALVRVTDGFIIQPVELRMQDLRMMRIRANFLIQLEAVDERKLQVDNVLHGGVQDELERLLEKRAKLNEERARDGLVEDEKAEIEREDARTRDRVEARLKVSRRVFDFLNRQLDARGTYEGVNWAEMNLEPEQAEYIRKLLGIERRAGEAVNPESLEEKLKTNDFTELKLPACADARCDAFLEVNSGLERRTFVGPVIFLSNTYRDSVRATDNLDEAKCGQKVDVEDPFEAEIRDRERTMFMDSDARVDRDRQNGLYKFSEYFGSLRHLCYTQVDDLIRREHEDRSLYESSAAAVASVHQFAAANKLDFLSLKNEKPQAVEISPDSIQRCGGNLVSCMRETEDRWVPADRGLELVNRHLGHMSLNPLTLSRLWAGEKDPVREEPWSIADLRSALFGGKSPRSARYAACALSVNHMLDQIRASLVAAGTAVPGSPTVDQAARGMITQCMNRPEQLVLDRKFRVFKTGRSGDPYIFLGGLQLNLNVGQSYSVSRSDSYSWSVGLEAFDVVGLAGKAWSLMAKPLSLKVGKSHGFGDSRGTSVAESTYLVAQIAGFKVRLDEYEPCVVLRMDPSLLRLHQPNLAYLSSTFSPEGLLVCEGEHLREPRYVREDYFYFTQHFTEGDMLDQADLYNHPWLLALRGQRDFGTFLNMVQAQEVVSMGNFVEGAWSGSKSQSIGWPLEQMLKVYRQITPSFPGFYTVLDEGEEMTQFPLERRMNKSDPDVNFEVIGRAQRAERRAPQ